MSGDDHAQPYMANMPDSLEPQSSVSLVDLFTIWLITIHA